MASKAQPEVYHVGFDPSLEAVLPCFPREKRKELFKRAANLLIRAITVAQGSPGEHGITPIIWGSLSFGRVGLAIFHYEVVITFDGSIPKGPDNRPRGVAALAASELSDALRASANLYLSLNPSIPARFMIFVLTCGDSNRSVDLDSLAKVNLMAGARKGAFSISTTEWSEDLYLALKMRTASIIRPWLGRQ